jgi:hypothetical protein
MSLEIQCVLGSSTVVPRVGQLLSGRRLAFGVFAGIADLTSRKPHFDRPRLTSAQTSLTAKTFSAFSFSKSKDGIFAQHVED